MYPAGDPDMCVKGPESIEKDSRIGGYSIEESGNQHMLSVIIIYNMLYYFKFFLLYIYRGYTI